MLDTNIMSYLLEGNDKIRQKLFSVMQGNIISIPEMVYYEILRGLLYNGSTIKLERFEAFCDLIPIHYMTKDSLASAAKIYAKLRKSGSIIEDSDIFIGAIALENNAILVTNNEKHLGRIEGLVIENWSI